MNKKKIIISPEYGVGWFSWNTQYPDCLDNPEIISLIESGASSDVIEELAKSLWENGYWNASSLSIEEVEYGEEFIIHEYDGAESIQYKKDFNWIKFDKKE